MSATGIRQDLLQAAVAALPPDDLAAIRAVAAERFATMGFPTVGEEDWKYTNLEAAVEISNSWLDEILTQEECAPETDTNDAINAVQNDIDAHWIIIRNGVVDNESAAAAAESGLTIARLSSTESASFQSEVAMSVFNAALLRDGLRISIAEGANVETPIGILYADNPSKAVSQTRLIVEAADNSRCRLIECSLSVAPGAQFTNAVFDAFLSSGARLDHVRIQNRSREHTGVNRIFAKLARDASYNHNSFDLGGSLTRNDVITDISDAGAAVSLNGLYLASGDQHIDNHTSILHRVGPATSVEEYRGILAGRSQCVFNGKVIVSEGADGTDSQQSNHNLLLSDRAEVDTKPELEIYADDVKCAHGATVGQLDETALFYLRSRGLDRDQARQVLTRAFAAGTLSALVVDECHDHLAALLDQRLESLVGEPV
jgi:Fe-S cluster assembly protein SufD